MNVITVSGKTAAWVAGSGGGGWRGVIEVVESKLKTSLFTQHQLLSELVTKV